MTARPLPFDAYTTPEFWNDPHISEQMLRYHLDPDLAPASRPHAFIDASSAWIAGEFRLGPGSTVLDLGCGPGLYAQRLASTGARVHGVDVSARSVAHATEMAWVLGVPATYVRANYLGAELAEGYDLALLIYEDYCALSPTQRMGLLRRVERALAPGGAMLFDVTAAPRFASLREATRHEEGLDGGFWAPAPYVGTHTSWVYPELRLGLDRYIIEAGGVSREYWNWIHCLTAEEVSAEVASAGLVADRVVGDVAGAAFDPASDTFAVIARKEA